jgi:hypothetical protein
MSSTSRAMRSADSRERARRAEYYGFAPVKVAGEGHLLKMTLISHGHYRVSDKDAGILARAVGRGLPRIGYEMIVKLPDGRKATLLRTPYSVMTDAPKRGWVWAVMV